MSLDRRKPLVVLHPNAGPTDAASATAYPSISRPRRQVPAYHHQLQQNPHKRYATVIPGSSRSSATSSAESLYSNASSMPRRRKLSAAADVAARVRARWATLEALERANGAPPPVESISATATATSHSCTSSRLNSHHIPTRRRRSSEPPELEPGLLLEKEKEKENAVPMQVDAVGYGSGYGYGSGHEKPLPPRPAALALYINHNRGTLSRSQSASARTPGVAMATTTTMTTAVVPMAVDSREDGYKNNGAGAGESVPASDSTLRTTPTSLTCFETDSLRPVLQRRPTRALTPPQVRRRPSVTDELEEAVGPSIHPPIHTHIHFFLNGAATVVRRKRPRSRCCRTSARTACCAVRVADATRCSPACGLSLSTCTSTPSRLGRMRACDAGARLRAQGSSRGTRVHGVGPEVRFFFFFHSFQPYGSYQADDLSPFFFFFVSFRRAPA